MMFKSCLLLAAAISAAAHAEAPASIIDRYGFAGEILIAKGDRILLHRAYRSISPGGGARHRVDERWRMASITKQVVAALLLKGTDIATLDEPIGLGWPTRRQLLTHHSGLANPDDTTMSGTGVPAYYSRSKPDLRYCRSKVAQPGPPFSYNNCDYIVLSSTRPGGWRWPAGLAMAKAGEVGVPGFIKGHSEPQFQLASWGASGGLIGTLKSLFAFDRSLMTGKLLPPAKLAELWKPEGNGSYQALGQWVFEGKLKGCTASKRIVQRDGEIFGVQARNYIFPDDDLVIIAFTNRSSDDFSFGEVWQQAGFSYDLLSSAACG